jgi:hypothetical protein
MDVVCPIEEKFALKALAILGKTYMEVVSTNKDLFLREMNSTISTMNQGWEWVIMQSLLLLTNQISTQFTNSLTLTSTMLPLSRWLICTSHKKSGQLWLIVVNSLAQHLLMHYLISKIVFLKVITSPRMLKQRSK